MTASEPETMPPGTLVADRHGPDDWAAIVVEHSDKPADEHMIEGSSIAAGQTVADLNPDYPADDDVITVAFMADVKRTVPHWRRLPFDDDPDVLRRAFDAYESQWSVGPNTYDYPSTRLRQYDGEKYADYTGPD